MLKLNIDQELEIIELKRQKVPLKVIMEKFNIKSAKTIYDVIDRNGREHFIANKKYSVNENYFDKINNEEKSYWLGFLYADGYVRLKDNKSGQLKLKLQRSDKNHIVLFNECLSSNYPIKNEISKVKYKNKVSVSEYSAVSIYNTKLVKDLIKHGCLNNKTFKLEFPLLDDSLMRHFIRGYFDGDGCIYKVKKQEKSNQITIVGNNNFIDSLKLYLINKLNINRINIKKNNNYKYLRICNIDDCKKIKHYFYNDSTIFLKRKKDIFDKI
jgi:hypothetical protein